MNIHTFLYVAIQIKNPEGNSGFFYANTTLKNWLQITSLSLSFIVLIFLWTILTNDSNIPSFIFPTPGDVWQKFNLLSQNGVILTHIWATLSEVLSGLLIGMILATILGYLIAKNPALETFLSPIIVVSQAIPTVAIAPLLIIWFGSGMISKIIICALIVFFPILTNTIVGIRSVPSDLFDLMDSLKANRWQRFTLLEFPGALPIYLGGVKVGATFSVIGAVVGEFVGANKGLGFLVNVGKGSFDTSMVFVAVFLLIFMALGLYGIVTVLEKTLLKWKNIE